MNRHPYTVVQWTNHYTIMNGRTYRDAVARRRTDGALRVVAFPEGVSQ